MHTQVLQPFQRHQGYIQRFSDLSCKIPFVLHFGTRRGCEEVAGLTVVPEPG